MKSKWISVMGIGIMAAVLLVALTACEGHEHKKVKSGSIVLHHQSEAEFPALAKISIKQALSDALKAVNGQPLEVELKNKGGFLVYEVEVVKADKTIMEAVVDAGNGKILAVEHEHEHKHEHDKD